MGRGRAGPAPGRHRLDQPGGRPARPARRLVALGGRAHPAHALGRAGALAAAMDARINLLADLRRWLLRHIVEDVESEYALSTVKATAVLSPPYPGLQSGSHRLSGRCGLSDGQNQAFLQISPARVLGWGALGQRRPWRQGVRRSG